MEMSEEPLLVSVCTDETVLHRGSKAFEYDLKCVMQK